MKKFNIQVNENGYWYIDIKRSSINYNIENNKRLSKKELLDRCAVFESVIDEIIELSPGSMIVPFIKEDE